MRNDAGLNARTPRTGRNSSFFPTSLRAISSYLRNVSVNASNIAATVRSAGASVASTVSLAEEERQREQVQWAGFDILELGPHNIRHVLLLTYLNGFQVWDVEEADYVQELVSKRDGPVRFLRIQPRPYTSEPCDRGLKSTQPLLLVVTGDVTSSGSGVGPDGGANVNFGGVGSPPTAGSSSHFVPTILRFYSLCSHTYVRELNFRTAIYAVRCSSRVVVIALAAQIYCLNAATLQNTFSVLTYPSPQAGPGGPNMGYGAIAVGPRWLAYAANQPLISNTGRVSPQHLTPSPGVSPSTSPANGNLVAHYAKESSKHIAAGIVTLGDMGYKTLSRYCSELLPDGASSPGSGSPNWKSTSNGLGVHSYDPEHAGTVIVRDFVSKTVIAQFRAHTSPLSALCFDPSGTLLVTASIHGHNLNVFRLIPSSTGSANLTGFDANASYVHLYKLCRGITHAVIQDISFSDDSHWIAVSSSRGTSHLFAISPFGGIVGPHTHGLLPVTGVHGIGTPMPAFPWWSSSGLGKSNQQTLLPPPPAITLSVVSRIKNGNGGWRGTVSGAAAAATGRNPSSGAVAVFFHDGRGKNLESEAGHSGLKDHLWVLSPPGHLIRYGLRPSLTGTEGVYSDDGSLDTGSVNTGQAHDLRVIVEPLQKWDVCRRPNWVEREDKVDMFGTSDGLRETNMVEAYKNAATYEGGSGSGRPAKESMRVEEMHRWYLSNAEVQMHQSKPPIWVKPEIYFHVFMGASSDEPLGMDELGGEIEVEKVPSRIVEVRRKDLVPVFEQLQNLRVQNTRDPMVEGVPGLSELNICLSKDDTLQNGFISRHVGCVQIQRSSSGSSSGSEGGLFGGTTTVLNGFQHPHQEMQEVHSIPSYNDLSTSFAHQSRLGCLHSDETVSQFGHGPNCNFSKPILSSQQTSTCGVIGSPPMDIPRQGRQDAYGKLRPFLNGAEGSPLSLQNRVVVLPNAKDESQFTETDTIDDTPGQLDATSSFQRDVDKQILSKISAQNKRGTSTVGKNGGMFCEDLKQESKGEATVIFNHERGHPQDYDAAVEDVESTDANSKSEDYEGGDQGDDVWEGAMFPFAEDS